MESNLLRHSEPIAAVASARERVEPIDPMPLKRGLCEWCGGKCGRRSYCSPACRVAYNNLLAKQGKAVMQMLKVWRHHRGRKETPGEGLMSKIAARTDAFLAEDRERKRMMQND